MPEMKKSGLDLMDGVGCVTFNVMTVLTVERAPSNGYSLSLAG
jgi:hypothetical protein